MAPLSDQQVRDLLYGDTDPRNLALFLAQQSFTMDPMERDQRETILRVLEVKASGDVAERTGELAEQTQRLAKQTARMASWTRVMAFATVLLAVVTIVVARW